MSRHLAIIALFIGVTSLGACDPLGPESTPPPVTVFIPGPTSTQIVCTQNPEGLLLEIQILSKGRIRIIGSGFLPNERVFVSVFGETTRTDESPVGQSTEYETTVSADGSLSQSHEFEPESGPAKWRVAVVHSRGVACASASSG